MTSNDIEVEQETQSADVWDKSFFSPCPKSKKKNRLNKSVNSIAQRVKVNKRSKTIKK